MILKGSQRGNGQNLAVHLMRTDDNEHVRIHEMRGFLASDLKGAFKETEAISKATKCKQYLFSLSLNPPEEARVPPEVFQSAVDRIEMQLGLIGQPRVLVFHEKNARLHAHCVWSRIDAETMTAKQMSFFKRRLMTVSRELFLEQGWEMPRGILNAGERNPLNFNLAEWSQAKRQTADPRWVKQVVQDCWKHADNRAAFERALEERSFVLAKGDRRGFVLLDHRGEVYSLSRMLGRTGEVGRLGDDKGLVSVEKARANLAKRMTPAIRRHIEEARHLFQGRSAVLGERKGKMTHAHREARASLEVSQTQERENEIRERAARLPKGIRGLWHRLTGSYQKMRSEHERAADATRIRHEAARQKLITAQLDQRTELQDQFKALRKAQAVQLLTLRKEVNHYRALTHGQTQDGGRTLER